MRPGRLSTLRTGEIDLWYVDLDQPDLSPIALWHVLSPDEQTRALRMMSSVHRRRYIAAHGGARKILARYLRVDAAEVPIVTSPSGKPSIGMGTPSQGIEFNQSHCGRWFVVSVARGRRVGVDIEQVRQVPERDAIAARWFTSKELTEYRRCDESRRSRMFFEIWTRKEAYLKATGEGICHSLGDVEAPLGPQCMERSSSSKPRLLCAGCWSVFDASPSEENVVGLVVEGQPVIIRRCIGGDRLGAKGHANAVLDLQLQDGPMRDGARQGRYGI